MAGTRRYLFPTLADATPVSDTDLIVFDEDDGGGGFNTVKKEAQEFFKWNGGLWAKTDLTSAQILAASVSPVLLLSGALAGAGNAIIPEIVLFRSLYQTTPYSATDIIIYSDAVDEAFRQVKGLDYSNDVFYYVPNVNGTGPELKANENWFFSTDGAATLGDSDGIVYIKFTVLPL